MFFRQAAILLIIAYAIRLQAKDDDKEITIDNVKDWDVFSKVVDGNKGAIVLYVAEYLADANWDNVKKMAGMYPKCKFYWSAALDSMKNHFKFTYTPMLAFYNQTNQTSLLMIGDADHPISGENITAQLNNICPN